MKNRSSHVADGHVSDGLEAQVETFLQGLAAVRYREYTRQEKRRTLDRFVRWSRTSGPTASDFDESLVDRYVERVHPRPGKWSVFERCTLHQFLDHLRSSGLVPPRCGPAPSPAEVLLGRYTDYLRQARGLSIRSVAVYSPLVREFVVAQDLAGRDTSLDAELIRRHLLDRSWGRSSESTRLLATALRSFLRFLFLYGETPTDLSIAVPSVRRWQHASVPQFLSPDEVEQVLAAIDGTTVRGRRDLAMLLLLARLGLRPGEVTTLELSDIHWSTGEILVRGKGGFHDRLPLPADVGEALASYLRYARGHSPSRRVFLRLKAPRVGLTGPSAVGVVARDALRRAGVRPRGRVGAHLFRHSLATQMIRHGASLGEISQVLRHRSVGTTQIYAKVDFEALRGVARPWPVAVGGEQ